MRLKLQTIIISAACVFGAGIFQIVQAQGSLPNVTLPRIDMSKMPKPVFKPLAADDKLKIVNSDLVKRNLPTVKNLAFGSSAKLDLQNMELKNTVSIGFNRPFVGTSGVLFEPFFYKDINLSSLNIFFDKNAAGRQFVDCFVGAGGVEANTQTKTGFSVEQTSSGKSKEIAQIIVSQDSPHLSFVADVGNSKGDSVRISSFQSWKFYGCEITPIQ